MLQDVRDKPISLHERRLVQGIIFPALILHARNRWQSRINTEALTSYQSQGSFDSPHENADHHPQIAIALVGSPHEQPQHTAYLRMYPTNLRSIPKYVYTEKEKTEPLQSL
jgi:hypothetical protein